MYLQPRTVILIRELSRDLQNLKEDDFIYFSLKSLAESTAWSVRGFLLNKPAGLRQGNGSCTNTFV